MNISGAHSQSKVSGIAEATPTVPGDPLSIAVEAALKGGQIGMGAVVAKRTKPPLPSKGAGLLVSREAQSHVPAELQTQVSAEGQLHPGAEAQLHSIAEAPTSGPVKDVAPPVPGVYRKFKQYFFYDTCGMTLGKIELKATINKKTGRFDTEWSYLPTRPVPGTTLVMAEVEVEDDGTPKDWKWGADSDSKTWAVVGVPKSFTPGTRPAVYSPVAATRLGPHRIQSPEADGKPSASFSVVAPNARDVRVVIQNKQGSEDCYQLTRNADGEWNGILTQASKVSGTDRSGPEGSWEKYEGQPYQYEFLTSDGQWVRRPDLYAIEYQGAWRGMDLARFDGLTGEPTNRFAQPLLTLKQFRLTGAPSNSDEAFFIMRDENGQYMSRAQLLERLRFDDDAMIAQMMRDRQAQVDVVKEHKLKQWSDAPYTPAELRLLLGEEGAADRFLSKLEEQRPGQNALANIDEVVIDGHRVARIQLQKVDGTFTTLIPGYMGCKGCFFDPYVYAPDANGKRTLVGDKTGRGWLTPDEIKTLPYGEPWPEGGDPGDDMGVRSPIVREFDFEPQHTQAPDSRPLYGRVLKQIHVGTFLGSEDGAHFSNLEDLEDELPYLKLTCTDLQLMPTSLQVGPSGNGYNGCHTLAQGFGYYSKKLGRQVPGWEAVARFNDAARRQGVRVVYDFVAGHHIYNPLRNWDGPEDLFYRFAQGTTLEGPFGDALAFSNEHVRQLLASIVWNALSPKRSGFSGRRVDAPGALTQTDLYPMDVPGMHGVETRSYRGAGDTGKYTFQYLSHMADLLAPLMFEIVEQLPPRPEISISTYRGGLASEYVPTLQVDRTPGYVLWYDHSPRNPNVRAIIQAEGLGLPSSHTLQDLLNAFCDPYGVVKAPALLTQALFSSVDQTNEAGGPPVALAMGNDRTSWPTDRARAWHRVVTILGLLGPGVPSGFQWNESMGMRQDPKLRYAKAAWDLLHTFATDRAWRELLPIQWKGLATHQERLEMFQSLATLSPEQRVQHSDWAKLTRLEQSLVYELSLKEDEDRFLRNIMQRSNFQCEADAFNARIEHPALQAPGPATGLFPVNEDNGVMAMYRVAPEANQRVTIVLNVSQHASKPCRVWVPSGLATVVINSDEGRYGGLGDGPSAGERLGAVDDKGLAITIPPCSVVALRSAAS